MALLAQLDPAEAREIVMRTGMPAQTPRTITDPALGGPALTAISISGPEARLTPSVVDRAVPLLQEVARRLSTELSYDDATA
jgi:IclR family acetate operon transcriptional repressor